MPLSGDEMARLALTVNGMLARLEQSFASLHRFTADASHELKTPLMVLRAGVERALVHPGVPAEILQSLDETLAQINQMTEMVESLLTLARADEGRAPLAVEESDLRELLGDVAETAGMLGEGAGITRDAARCRSSRCGCAVDRHRIREMLLNLVTNAIKYTPAGRHDRLWRWPSRTARSRLTVRDTGIGIAPGDLPHIFERFWRADPARSRTGERPGHRPGPRHHQVDRGGARRLDHGAEPAGAGHRCSRVRARPGVSAPERDPAQHASADGQIDANSVVIELSSSGYWPAIRRVVASPARSILPSWR